ncbi:MAG: ABC transporter permease, partial [Anaerolineales bacterium]|nr:ABC transporter permease [Anaerolineales bacterium]
GSPVDVLLAVDTTPEQRARMERYLGLDRPLYIQYWRFISRAVQGDLGQSITLMRPVSEVILERWPATLQLGAYALVFSLIVALPVGVYAAVRRGGVFDFVGRMFAIVGQSAPGFWVGMILILIFAVWLDWLPAGGLAGPASFILPSIALGWYVAAGIMRLMRSSMLDVLDSEYIKLARIKGLPERMVIWKHAFINALLPVITYAAILFVYLLTGAVTTEIVFSWPGVGQLIMYAVTARDYPLIQGIVLLLATLFIMSNFTVDILYAYLNPRIRYGK